MDNIKSIISNNEGQRDYNFLPPSVLPATFIKGKKGSTPITMEGIQYPIIALDKYGVTFQQPDQKYNYKSKGVLEMPYMPGSIKKDEEMPTAQQGGSQGDQIEQLIAVYAQMKGVSPEEIIKQLQQLPKEQQQKALESIAQEVQQAMAQQQQQQMAQQQQAGPEQQEAMMGQQDQENPQEQEQEMAGQGMMEEGGEPCFGCYDHYNPSPQAQDLEWYYKKAKGGLTRYQDDGEVDEPRYNRFDDALHNLPIWNKAEQNILNKYAGLYSNRESDEYGYDNLLEKIRPDISNPRHVLMEKIKYPWQQISNPYVDREFDNNATSSEGYFYNQSDMTPEEIRDRAFDDNLKLKGLTRGTGLMPYKYEAPDELNQGLATGGEAFRQANTYPEDWGSYHGNQYAIGGNTVLQSDPNAQTYLPYMRKGETRPNFMFAEGGDTTDQWGGQSDIDRAYQMMKMGGFAMNPKKKKGGKFNHLDEFKKYLQKGGGLKKYQNAGEYDGTPYNKYYPSPHYTWGNTKDVLSDVDAWNALQNNYYESRGSGTPNWYESGPLLGTSLKKGPSSFRSKIDPNLIAYNSNPDQQDPNDIDNSSSSVNVNVSGNNTVSDKPTLSGNYPNTGQYFNTSTPSREYSAVNPPTVLTGRGYGFMDPNDKTYGYERGYDEKNGQYADVHNFKTNKTKRVFKNKNEDMYSAIARSLPRNDDNYVVSKDKDGNKIYAQNPDGSYIMNENQKGIAPIDYSHLAGNPPPASNQTSSGTNNNYTITGGNSTITGDDMYNYEGFDPFKYRNPKRASRHFLRGTADDNFRGKGWEEKRDQMRKDQMNPSQNNSNTSTTTNTGSSSAPSGNQYVGNVNADNYNITRWHNGNIKKIKGTPNRPQSNVTWNTPGAAYIQGAANSRLFGTSGLGLALSTITGALNPNVAPSTGSTFKAKYRPDGSLRKVKGSASDVYNFFNPNAAGTDKTTSSTTTTPSTVNPYNTANQNYLSKQNTINQKIAGLDPTSSDYYSQVAAAQKEMDDLDTKFNTWSQGPQYRRGGAYHYLPIAQMGLSDPFDAGNGSVDDLNKMNSSSSQDWNEYAIKENNPSSFDYTSNRQATQGASDPGKDVRVRITERSGFGTPNKKAIQAMGAILGAANAGLDAKAANRKQDAYINSMENRDTTSNMAFNTGNATQTQFGSPGAAVNDKRQVFPNGPGSNIPGGANYGTPLFNTGLSQIASTRDGGTIYDRYEDGGEYDLTDEEIEEILAARGTIQYI